MHINNKFNIMKMLRQATFVLWILCLLLAGTGFFILVQPVSDKKPDIVNDVALKSPETKADKPEIIKQQSFEPYEKVFSTRDAFQSLAGSSIPGSSDKELDGAGSGSVSFREDRYKIVGIMIDQQPRVVFEGKKDRKIFFLSVGDTIDGGVVKAILPGKVVLDVNGDVFEMRP